MPTLFTVAGCLFFSGVKPIYRLLGLPLLIVIAFMTTLAAIDDRGQTIRIKRWWGSIEVPKPDVTEYESSSLEGIGVLRIRRFALPWGHIYYVEDWSHLEGESKAVAESPKSRKNKSHGLFYSYFEPIVLAVSGFLAAQAIRSNIPEFGVQASTARICALALATALLLMFLVIKRMNPRVANISLFFAILVMGLIRW